MSSPAEEEAAIAAAAAVTAVSAKRSPRATAASHSHCTDDLCESSSTVKKAQAEFTLFTKISPKSCDSGVENYVIYFICIREIGTASLKGKHALLYAFSNVMATSPNHHLL